MSVSHPELVRDALALLVTLVLSLSPPDEEALRLAADPVEDAELTAEFDPASDAEGSPLPEAHAVASAVKVAPTEGDVDALNDTLPLDDGDAEGDRDKDSDGVLLRVADEHRDAEELFEAAEDRDAVTLIDGEAEVVRERSGDRLVDGDAEVERERSGDCDAAGDEEGEGDWTTVTLQRGDALRHAEAVLEYEVLVEPLPELQVVAVGEPHTVGEPERETQSVALVQTVEDADGKR